MNTIKKTSPKQWFSLPTYYNNQYFTLDISYILI